MAGSRIDIILTIHNYSIIPLYKVLEGISEEHFNWKPALESRSINEIMCHLIRVDNSFLTKLAQQPRTLDPKNGIPADVLQALIKVHDQIRNLVRGCKDDSELFKVSNMPGANESDTIGNHITHSCQHNLYHLAQVIYLRRGKDRTWTSPIDDWDKATRVIANYLLVNKDQSN